MHPLGHQRPRCGLENVNSRTMFSRLSPPPANLPWPAPAPPAAAPPSAPPAPHRHAHHIHRHRLLGVGAGPLFVHLAHDIRRDLVKVDSRGSTGTGSPRLPTRRPPQLHHQRALSGVRTRSATTGGEAAAGDEWEGRGLPVPVLPLESDFDQIAAYVVSEVDKKWPSADPSRRCRWMWWACRWGAGGALGGAAAGGAGAGQGRFAGGGDQALNIVRLFTFSSPHRGALMAERVHIDAAACDMCAGRRFWTR